MLRFFRAVVCVGTVLSGCSSVAQNPTQLTAPPAKTHDPNVSWMDASARKTPSLLYVSNYGGGNVTVYSYENGNDIKQVGSLNGFSGPKGLCTDKAGNIWVTDYPARALYEFAHGGTKPIATIKQHGGYPNDCAVDLKTGNLAVANLLPTFKYRDEGTVTIYAPGEHHGKHYNGGSLETRYFYLAYDDKSDLFVECKDDYGYIGPLAELPAGSTYMRQIELGPSIQFSQFSGLQWIKPTLLMGGTTYDDYSSVAYKLLITGSSAQIVDTLQLTSTTQPAGLSRRAGNITVADSNGNAVQVYRLSDGSLVSSFTEGLLEPDGTAISALPRGR